MRIWSFLAVLGLAVPAGVAANDHKPLPARDHRTVHVRCDRGESLTVALAKLDTHKSHQVVVHGTCTESVEIRGHERLSLRGVRGAAIVQPTADPGDGLLHAPLVVTGSHVIEIQKLTLRPAGNGMALAIRGGASDVRLRDLTLEGGFWVFEGSQVLAAGLAVGVAGGFGSFVGDMSDIHLEDSVFENSASGWSVGIYVASQLTMHNTIIRDFYQGLYVADTGTVHIQDYANLQPEGGPTEVLVENPAGLNQVGCQVAGKVDLGTTLRITNAGQPHGWDSAALRVERGGAMGAAGHLQVVGSLGQGVLVTDNSTLSLQASAIEGGLHGGLVAVNGSTVAVIGPGATVSGNATDLFCDSTSLISGSDNILGATTIACANLRPGHYESLP